MKQNSETVKIDFQGIINDILAELKSVEQIGKPADYIPELAKVCPQKFGIQITTINGEKYSSGDTKQKFSIQSIAKVLSLTLAFDIYGEKLWERVGVEPSGDPFNSLIQLEYEKGIPRNPLINSGALVVCDALFDALENPKVQLLNFIRKISNNENIYFNEKVAESEKETGYRNSALINLMKSFGNIKNNPTKILDLYFYLCSVEMTCEELSSAFIMFANKGIPSGRENPITSISKIKRINAIMQTCGFYDESGEFAFKVGLPGKSGVGGGIVAVHPGHYSVSVWSPPLNKKGNSYMGMKALELLTTKSELSIF